MNTKMISRLTVLPLVAARGAADACSKQSEPAGHGADDGHGHGEAKAHTETKDRRAEDVHRAQRAAEANAASANRNWRGHLKPGESAKVRLAANDSAAIAGVQTATPTVGTIADAVECYAELTFNQNKLAQIAAPVGGIIQEVSADLGSKVEEKQAVAKIWSASIAEAVAKAVLSHQTLDRERKLRADRVTSEKDLQQAEAEHRAACQQLRTLGFTEEQIDALGAKPHEQVLMEVRAPFAGEIVERTAVRGALVEAGKSLFTLADRSVMWAMLNIPESALARVKVGQTVELRVESLPGQTFTGKLTWIGGGSGREEPHGPRPRRGGQPGWVAQGQDVRPGPHPDTQRGRRAVAAVLGHSAHGRQELCLRETGGRFV